METMTVECLRCGERREAALGPGVQVQPGECRRCGDVSWTRPADLSDRDRTLMRMARRGRRLAAVLSTRSHWQPA